MLKVVYHIRLNGEEIKNTNYQKITRNYYVRFFMTCQVNRVQIMSLFNSIR